LLQAGHCSGGVPPVKLLDGVSPHSFNFANARFAITAGPTTRKSSVWMMTDGG